MPGKLFILSGQSGVGKNTILKAILKKHPEIQKVVTFTDREPRKEEIPGKDHYFVSKDKFKTMIKNGEFLEYAETHGNLYGTEKNQIDKALGQGKNVIMEMDVKGVSNIKDKYHPVTIFIKYDPGDIDQLIRDRLMKDPNRQGITEEEIKTRIATAKKEAAYEKEYEYTAVNPEGQPETAINEVETIIKKLL